MNYYEKYLKYKNKYINSKRNQKGGAPTDMEFMGITEIKYNLSKTTHEFKKELHLVKIVLDEKNNDKPVLFVLAGMSHKSFLGTSEIILSKLDELKQKFKEVYLLEYESYKNEQTRACGYRDKLSELREGDEKIYEPEYIMNYEIANNIDKIIQELGLTNVHLLGKCNGAWVVSLLLVRNERYKALFLAVPGIPSINGVPLIKNILSEIKKPRIDEINFVFGWHNKDAFQFNWGKSSDEKVKYDKVMEELKITKNYKSDMLILGDDIKEDIKIYHELYPELIDKIIGTIP
jgi:hypothetical protein